RVLAEGKVDALVVMDAVEDDPRIPALATAPRPVVLLGYPTQAQRIPRVDFDFEQATALAVTELHRRGAHRLVMIGSPSATQTRHATYADPPPAASARPARTWGSALITWSTTTRSSP